MSFRLERKKHNSRPEDVKVKEYTTLYGAAIALYDAPPGSELFNPEAEDGQVAHFLRGPSRVEIVEIKGADAELNAFLKERDIKDKEKREKYFALQREHKHRIEETIGIALDDDEDGSEVECDGAGGAVFTA